MVFIQDQRAVDALVAERAAMFEQESVLRATFARSCAMRPCFPGEYAKWLSDFISDGGEVAIFTSSFMPLDLAAKSPGMIMPVLHDRLALRLVVLDDVVVRAGINGEPQVRDGEWGHSVVYSYVGGKAWTSNSERVECSPEVIRLLKLSRRRWRELETQLDRFGEKEYQQQCNKVRYQGERAFGDIAKCVGPNDFPDMLNYIETKVARAIAESRAAHDEFTKTFRQNRATITSMMS
ncbi:MAG: hypothetical protein ABI397_02910 [Candidatus Saccharimonas sp.]